MKKNVLDNTQDLLFQITDWDYYHEEIDVEEDTLKKYVIRLYGTTNDHKKIFVKVEDYTPYFYVRIPKEWKKPKVEQFVGVITEEVKKNPKNNEILNSLKNWDIVDRCIFKEFTNYKLFQFVRLIFHSYEGFRAYERVLNKPIKNFLLGTKPMKYELYESNIEPNLRFMHTRDLQAVGWVSIKGTKYHHFPKDKTPSNNDICIRTNWKNLDPVKDTTIVPLIIAAFDIECMSEDGSFPQPQRDGDKIIQIGTTFSRYGEDDCFYKHIITLGSCDKIEGADVESYDNEVAVLLAWTKLMIRMNPDVVTGYNIFGFDYEYMKERAKKFGCENSFAKFSRLTTENAPFIEKDLSSSALGQNKLKFYAMQGRIQVDIMKVVQKDYKLGSYKLDNVAAEFIKEAVIKVEMKDNQTTIFTKSTYGLEVGRYIKINYNDGLSDNSYKNEAKYQVLKVTKDTLTIDGILDGEALELTKYKVSWCQAKDDVGPNDIFRLQKGSSKDRAIIAKYCLVDCILCNKLMNKLQILTNNIGMANVCHVPLTYIFLRGQGIKIFSLVAKKCRERNHLIPVIKKPYKPKEGEEPKFPQKKKMEEEEQEEEEGYEGATVFEPTLGVHYEPITVLDYNSLYPNSMRMKGLSQELHVKNPEYDNLPGYYYNTATYTNKDGSATTCKFASPKDGKLGILPEILTELLNKRSEMKNLAEDEKDPFKKKVLDGLQLAYKITANSLYGQTGAPTSPIYCKEIAAATTSTGREMLNAARIFTEMMFTVIVKNALDKDYETYSNNLDLMFNKHLDELIGEDNISKLQEHIEGELFPRYHYLDVFKNNRAIIDETYSKFIDKKANINNKTDFKKWLYEEIIKAMDGKNIAPNVIYGDTDSIFIKYNIRKNGETDTLKDQEALETSIKLGQLTSKLLFTILPVPQNMLYEKTFMPFTILSKKRYVGNKYESDPKKYYQNSMGIVLKRRDNAPIVKIVVGGIVKSILNDKSPEKAVAFTKDTLKKILSNKYPMDKFIITKTLKGNALTENERALEEQKPKEERSYADRTRIVHAVLADRMADRDPGNKPLSNDRIPYAYIVTKGDVELQGDRVEHPDYIIEHKLQLDYLFYITNQIMKPSLQFLEHVTENPDKIFETCIMKELNRREGKRPLTYYFNLLQEMKQNNDDVFSEDNEDEDVDEDNTHTEHHTKFSFNFDLDDEISDDDEPVLKKIGKKKITSQSKQQTKIQPKKTVKKRVINHKPVYDENKGGFVVNI